MNTSVPKRYVEIILGVLVVIFLFLCLLLVREYNYLKRQELMSLYHDRVLSSSRPSLAADISLIQSWMTFDYINVTFKIPPDVLKSSLHITDAHYPRISLARYAKSIATSSPAFLLDVQNAVRDFLAQKK
ncbi:MAG: hypothetical protein PHV42_01680 [Candidatus Pacebacteria bacterium]|nr:hypothetical protein [Candidatus Paceibacterota bacterium]